MNQNIIPRRSLADEVASQLQEKILKGGYKVNQKLPVEAELMRTYGVGRSTVREAVKTLVNSGFLKVQQGIGTFVKDSAGMGEPLLQRLTRADAKDINEVRQILEIRIAEKAAMNRNGNDISKLEHFLAKRTKAADENLLPECVDAHVSFYIALAEAAKNPILADLYKLFATQLKAGLLETYENTDHFKETSGWLLELFDGVLREDAKKAWYWGAKIAGQTTHDSQNPQAG